MPQQHATKPRLSMMIRRFLRMSGSDPFDRLVSSPSVSSPGVFPWRCSWSALDGSIFIPR